MPIEYDHPEGCMCEECSTDRERLELSRQANAQMKEFLEMSKTAMSSPKFSPSGLGSFEPPAPPTLEEIEEKVKKMKEGLDLDKQMRFRTELCLQLIRTWDNLGPNNLDQCVSDMATFDLRLDKLLPETTSEATARRFVDHQKVPFVARPYPQY